MSKRIIVTVTNDLVTDQRVERVCSSLHRSGYRIILLGRKNKTSPGIVRPYPVVRMRMLFRKGFAFYSEYNIRLFWFLLFSRFDLVLANDLDTLPACRMAAWFRGKKLVYDSHEYFTEVPELICRKGVRSFWLRMERIFLKGVKNAYTVNQTLADIYMAKYRVPMRVVRNCPSLANQTMEEFRIDTGGRAYIIYQGALNVGRGLEIMMGSMRYLKEYALVMAGDGDIRDEIVTWIREQNPQKNVFYAGRLMPDQLRSLTSGAILGLSLERADQGLNYYYALPNKLFDYIHAGIPVLVSALPEMERLVVTTRVGRVSKADTAEDLAAEIADLLTNQQAVIEMRMSALKAKEELTWENEEKELLAIFKEACS